MKHFNYILTLIILILVSSCKNDKNISEENPRELNKEISVNYEEIGLNIAFSTKAELGKNLMGAIKEKGTLEALQFCNIKATTITDSMATLHQAKIRRVSDKTRNPDNLANETELENISYFKNNLAKGEEINPIVETRNDSIYFYYPIVTNDMCMQCHGIPNKEIDQTILLGLNDLYPTDKAIGYSVNQVRGIWSIQFKKQ